MSIRTDELDVPEQRIENELRRQSKKKLHCRRIKKENYIASGPSQPPKLLASPPTSIAESLAVIACLSVIVISWKLCPPLPEIGRVLQVSCEFGCFLFCLLGLHIYTDTALPDKENHHRMHYKVIYNLRLSFHCNAVFSNKIASSCFINNKIFLNIWDFFGWWFAFPKADSQPG